MGAVSQRNMLRFVKANPDMVKALEGKDVFFPVILAIGYAESGFNSDAAKNRNNYFGIDNGRTKFSSAGSAFAYQANLFYEKEYKKLGVTKAKDPYEQMKLIADAGYYEMDNDGSLGENPKIKPRLGNAKWNNKKQRWIRPDGSIVTFTKSESHKYYYDTIKPFINDALIAIPIGKVINSSQIIASL
jgi:hypothetical protein